MRGWSKIEMVKKGLVSVIIPNYNYAIHVGKAIDSVLNQTYQNVEVIVVDDGSTDNSRAVLASYGESITVMEQTNEGVSKARNRGVSKAQGEFVAFLDADDIWLPTKIEKQIERFKRETDLGLVHCSMTYIDNEDRPIGEITDGMEGWVAEEFLRFEGGVVIGAGSTALVPKAVFDEVGGFDPRQSTAADWDFSYRVATRYKIGFAREPLVNYRQHGTNMHGNIRAMEHDMLLGYEKAFANGASGNRRECYSNLHKTLSGSYFRSRNYGKCIGHAIKSVWLRPSKIGYFLSFPIRNASNSRR
jgi:glycosyltransferase involved in cell wall biosynthesis